MGLIDDLRGAASGVLQRLAVRPDPDVSGDEMGGLLRKAGLGFPEATEEKPRGLYHDPYQVIDWGGWRERPSALTYETLRAMASKNTVIAAIITLRCNQVGQFCRPQQGKYDRGFRVIKRDRRDRWKTMSPEEQKEATAIERMLESTGVLLPGEQASDRDSFTQFIKKGTRDILTYDQWCFEKIRDRGGRLSRIQALPSESIRPAVVDQEYLDPAERRSRVSHVQVYEETVIAEFSPQQITWAIMNPRSDLRVAQFGFSPIEQLIHLVTAWLYGFEYNQRFFSQGSAIKGILNVKGAIPDRQLRAFRRMWYSQLTGVTNAWRTPILNSEDIQWQSLHSTNREMEFSAWMDWLTKLTCAIFGIDPIEINFQYGNTGQTNSLATGGQEEKLSESKDKGLRPLMDHISDVINRHIVWEINDDFEFAFTGLDAKSESEEREARIKEAGSYRMVDEVRADDDLPPLADGLGQMIQNPTWLQFASQKAAEKQQADAAAAGQVPGAPPGEGAPFGGEDEEGAPEPPPEGEEALGGEGETELDENGEIPETALKAAAFDRSFAVLRKSIRRRVENDRVVVEFDLPTR